MKSKLKHLIDEILLKFKYELSYRAKRWQSGRTYWESNYIKRLGFCPRTVVDVGVGYGTPSRESHALYEAFPDSYLVLIEPLKEFEPYMQRILKKYRGEYFLTAVGSKDGEKIINIESPYGERSSIFNRAYEEMKNIQISQREIPVTTIDSLLEKGNFQPPYGLKIDVEGFEVEVIEGASQFLKQTEFIISEVPVINRFEDGYSFADFIRLMEDRDFTVYDILEIGRADNSKVTFMDIIFRKS